MNYTVGQFFGDKVLQSKLLDGRMVRRTYGQINSWITADYSILRDARTDISLDRQTVQQRGRQRDRQTDRRNQKDTDIQNNGPTDRKTFKESDIEREDRQTERTTNRQIRMIDR